MDEYLTWYRAVGHGPIYSHTAPPIHYEPRGPFECELVRFGFINALVFLQHYIYDVLI